MLTFERFSGLDNQHRPAELTQDPKTKVCALVRAMNVDLDLEGRPRRRAGFTQADTGIWRNVWEGTQLALATKDGDLVNIESTEVLYETLSGSPRSWFVELPDGRVAFSNSLICGITDGTAEGTTKWGVPLPASVGSISKAPGDLFPGRYQWAITHVRTDDGLEGGPQYAAAFDVAEGEGSITWTGLPVLADHTTNIYLTSHNDDVLYLATSTSTDTAQFTGANTDLLLRLKTDNCYPAPAGTCLAYWRGRALLASGPLLLASRAQQWELFDLARDVKAFPSDITMIMPVQGGIWVGTQTELAYLRGDTWDGLKAEHDRVPGPVALGSGVLVDGNVIGGEHASGPAAVCIADGYVTACFSDGSFNVLTDKVYRTDGTEYAATFRMQDEIPQYIAVEQ